MATRKTKVKRTTKKKASAKSKPKTKDALVVFAIRLAESERDAIHRAAGPRGATRFVRSLAVAAARNDLKGIQQVLKDAKAARS